MQGVTYEHIDDDGLHILQGNTPHTLAVDHIVVCAGQESQQSILRDVQATNIPWSCIGGASKAMELDAKRAIEQGWEVSLQL